MSVDNSGYALSVSDISYPKNFLFAVRTLLAFDTTALYKLCANALYIGLHKFIVELN